MVTRVDKKPIIYNTCLLRVIRPSVVSHRKELIESILAKSVGHAIPQVSPRDIIDDYDDIEGAMQLYGINDPAFHYSSYFCDEDEQEAMEIARSMVRSEANIRKALRSAAAMDEVYKVQKVIMEDAKRVYFGTEAVYAFLSEFRSGNVVKGFQAPTFRKWVAETTRHVVSIQSPYMFIHPSALNDLTAKVMQNIGNETWNEWASYKCAETIALRLFSKKNLAAHACLYGINRRGFEASSNPADDFEIRLHSDMNACEDFKVYSVLGVKYLKVADMVFCLTQDDCVNMASMAQCFYRNTLYFTTGNGYLPGKSREATKLADGILMHCRRFIDAKKNYADIIRALHILAQGDFNDMYEAEMGTDLGWRDRSANYVREAKGLDPACVIFHEKAMMLARTHIDRLNVGFIYHCFVGDEMLIKDLKDKIIQMPKKVRSADQEAWSHFIKFCKAYLLCRFMKVNKRKPAVSGDVTLLNEVWADRCIAGQFTMPPQSSWGKVWIAKEFSYSKFADTWHLDAQDVSYVVKDSKGLVDGKYKNNRLIHSELLMAMTSGNVLDVLTGSTPKSARERIKAGKVCSEVAVTTAPKAENAKPTWKKRVTFAADCEFRKMQAEYDRNCRKIIGFVRGPSLGVDQTILEKQFADIAMATQSGASGGICSHDIAAWSESMDRARKFEFEKVLLDMLDYEGMENMSLDWAQIKAVVSKQGTKEIYPLSNGSFQGFDGSASTILHSMILLYCIDSARREKVMDSSVKANMATLIDDCIALMDGLTNTEEANKFWAHLKVTYLKLGFEVDDLKSIFSTIKAIYLSRRFLCGAEVPADYKVFVKTHMSYEDPLRCALDAPSDIFGALRGAADANGNCWFIYIAAVMSTLSEICFFNPTVTSIPPAAACVFALAPGVENGWSFPSMIDWATNDVNDKRSHFNAIMECAASFTNSPDTFRRGSEVFTKTTGRALLAIKSQAWRIVSVSNIFTSPFEAIREGPLKPDMLRRNAVQDMLRETATAEPWVSLLAWNVSLTTERVRQLLISSGPLHAPTLSALVNCMPDNYRLSLVGKAVGSQSLLDLLPKGQRSNLKRRVSRCSASYFDYSVSIYKGASGEYSSCDFATLTYIERSTLEREEFYTANGCEMLDHTFPDPVSTFTHCAKDLGSFIAPNLTSLIEHDRINLTKGQTKDFYAPRGLYVPRKSARVWEVTSEYAKGWDTVSQRIAMGLAVLARAEADHHEVRGLLTYFVKSWNELSNITPNDTHMISINGSIKRLDANPGSSSHPIIVHRNILRGINFSIKTSLDVIATELERTVGNSHNLHDLLAHETAILTVTALQLSCFISLNVADRNTRYNLATRPDCIVPESTKKMTTNCVDERITIEIMESGDNYGLLQSCPDLVEQIAIPTMRSSWVDMINALITGDNATIENLCKQASNTSIDDLLQSLSDKESTYCTSVILAAEPAQRGIISAPTMEKYALVPESPSQSSEGDAYTMSVKPIQSKFTRALSQEQPDYLVSAIIIRSIIWSRLKSKSLMALSAIFYNDPDCDVNEIKECATQNFWRSVVIEVSRKRDGKPTSELLMKGFRSLGVHDLHIRATDDVAELTQSIASYFGANLKKVTRLIGDQILSVAGRSSNDFEKPFLQRVVTHNPTMFNIKLRKEHLTHLIKYNLEQLTSRIDKLGTKDMVHRGDKRACQVAEDTHSRLVELRCRKYVYMHIAINEQGEAYLKCNEYGDFIRSCAASVAERFDVPLELIPEAPTSFEDALEFTSAVDTLFKTHHKTMGKITGWEATSGNIGSRMAYDAVMSDSRQVASTKFAVSAAEIAPRLFKRVITSVPAAPKPTVMVDDDDWDPDDIDFSILGTGGGSRVINLAEGNFDGAGDLFRMVMPESNVEPWQMLYTLVYTHSIDIPSVRERLSLDLVDNPDPSDIRNAHLEYLDKDTILSNFPDIVGDYISCGAIFDPDWLERDEAHAYTVDELAASLRSAFGRMA